MSWYSVDLWSSPNSRHKLSTENIFLSYFPSRTSSTNHKPSENIILVFEYQKISYQNWIAYSGWTCTKPTVSKTYDVNFPIQNTNSAISRYINIYQYIIVFCFSYQFQTISNPLYHFVFVVYPLKWHETEYFSVKPVENWEYVLGKWHETENFLVKPVKNWDFVWNQLSWNYVYLLIWNGCNLKNLNLWPFTFGKQKFL